MSGCGSVAARRRLTPTALGATGAGGTTKRTLPRPGDPAPPGRASRHAWAPHPTRDGAPPSRAGSPRQGVRAARPQAGRATWRGLRHRWARPTVPPGPHAPRSQRCRSAPPVWHARAADAGGVTRASGLAPHCRPAPERGRARGHQAQVALGSRAWRSEAGGGRSRHPRRRLAPRGTDARGGRVRQGGGLRRRGHGILGPSGEAVGGRGHRGEAPCQCLRPTRACRRPPRASARASLRLLAAPDA